MGEGWGELPEGWELKRLGEVVDVLDGRRVPVNAQEREKRKGNIPYYGATGQVGWIDDHLFDEELVCLGEDGAPFLEREKSKAYIIRGKSWVNNHAHVMRAQSVTSNGYLCHYLNQFDYTGHVNGTTRLKLTQGAMREIPVPLPPLPEQHRLVSKIERLFAESRTAREALERVPALLKRFRQAVLAKAFRGDLTPLPPSPDRKVRGQERGEGPGMGGEDEPASVLLARIRTERRHKWEETHHLSTSSSAVVLRTAGDSATVARTGKGKKAKYVEPEPPDVSGLPELPEGWCWASVEQVAEVRLGRQRSPSRATGPNMRPYLRAANVTWNGLGLSDVKEMDFSPEEQEIYRLQAGDVILAEASGSVSEVGKPAIWNGEIENCCIQNTLIRVRSDGPLPQYLHYHFLYDALTARFSKVTQGISINHLGAKGLSRWIISVPPLTEQHRIVAKIESLFAQAEAIERAVAMARRRAEKVDQAILARAFRGGL